MGLLREPYEFRTNPCTQHADTVDKPALLKHKNNHEHSVTYRFHCKPRPP
jgi:hypothetical protein